MSRLRDFSSISHLFHSDCLIPIYGAFPSRVTHGKRRENHLQTTTDDNEDETEDDDDDDDEDEDEDEDEIYDGDNGDENDEDDGDNDDEVAGFDISSHCPKCPKCKQLDHACSKAERNDKGHCNPVRKVFFDTEPTGQGRPFPLILSIPGQMTQRLDLVIIAKKLGVTVNELEMRARSLTPRSWAKMSASIEDFNKEVMEWGQQILEDKTSSSLTVSAHLNRLYLHVSTDISSCRRPWEIY